MKLDEDGRLIEPKVGDAELLRLDFDHAGIIVHIKLTGPDASGKILFLRIVNPRWFSFCTDFGQNVINEILITTDLKRAVEIAPEHIRDMLWRREQKIAGQTALPEPLKAMYISPTAGPEMLCIADDIVNIDALDS